MEQDTSCCDLSHCDMSLCAELCCDPCCDICLSLQFYYTPEYQEWLRDCPTDPEQYVAYLELHPPPRWTVPTTDSSLNDTSSNPVLDPSANLVVIEDSNCGEGDTNQNEEVGELTSNDDITGTGVSDVGTSPEA